MKNIYYQLYHLKLRCSRKYIGKQKGEDFAFVTALDRPPLVPFDYHCSVVTFWVYHYSVEIIVGVLFLLCF